MTSIIGRLGAPLTAAALIVLLGGTLADIYRARDAMTAARANQEQPLALSGRVEKQLDALAKGTKRLADGGNTNAGQIIEVLQRNGVNISDR